LSIVTVSGAQQTIDGIDDLVDGPIQVFPLSADLDVGPVHPPTFADRPLARAERFFPFRQQLQHPSIDRRMADRETELGHHLFKGTQAQRVGHVPGDAPGIGFIGARPV